MLLFFQRVFSLGVYLYGAGVLCIWALLRFCGDVWWFATVLLYGPRWIYLLPMCFFLPVSVLWERRYLIPLGLIAGIIIWPVMGFNVAFPKKNIPDTAFTLRVVTYNVQRWEVNKEEFAALLDAVQPDIVAIQECASPRWLEVPSPWYTKRSVYSMVVSRYPINDSYVLPRVPETSGLYCTIKTPGGIIGFCSVDLLTPRRSLAGVLDPVRIFNFDYVDTAQEGIDFRWAESENLFKWIKGFGDEKILAGDFNLTTDSPIYRKYWSGYQNAFTETGLGFGYTKKTRINIFSYQSRIDHILSTPGIRPVRTWLGPDFGSDHLPVVVEFVY